MEVQTRFFDEGGISVGEALKEILKRLREYEDINRAICVDISKLI